jgi:uncharacterized protein YndB with AHSA1/START domain
MSIPETEVTRELTLDATPEEVWEVIADREERAAWLGDDGAGWPTRIDEIAPGERLVWTWWPHPDTAPSQVTITLAPAPTGPGTVLRVVERLAPSATPMARAATGRAWQRRLMGVELLFVLAHARV